jgi:hypothetical protein
VVLTLITTIVCSNNMSPMLSMSTASCQAYRDKMSRLEKHANLWLWQRLWVGQFHHLHVVVLVVHLWRHYWFGCGTNLHNLHLVVRIVVDNLRVSCDHGCWMLVANGWMHNAWHRRCSCFHNETVAPCGCIVFSSDPTLAATSGRSLIGPRHGLVGPSHGVCVMCAWLASGCSNCGL